MRTTLTLDDDVADYLKEQSRWLKKPFKQVVNEVLRRGIASGLSGPDWPKFKVVPNNSGLVSGVDRLKLNRIIDQLEVEDFTGQKPT